MCKNLFIVLQLLTFLAHLVPLLLSLEANCTDSQISCPKTCNEASDLPYSSTFCDTANGACVCDCRDTQSTSCTRDPDSDCNILCENKNPNPDIFTYIGSFCPALGLSPDANKTICVCSCLVNPDYVETNDVF